MSKETAQIFTAENTTKKDAKKIKMALMGMAAATAAMMGSAEAHPAKATPLQSVENFFQHDQENPHKGVAFLWDVSKNKTPQTLSETSKTLAISSTTAQHNAVLRTPDNQNISLASIKPEEVKIQKPEDSVKLAKVRPEEAVTLTKPSPVKARKLNDNEMEYYAKNKKHYF